MCPWPLSQLNFSRHHLYKVKQVFGPCCWRMMRAQWMVKLLMVQFPPKFASPPPPLCWGNLPFADHGPKTAYFTNIIHKSCPRGFTLPLRFPRFRNARSAILQGVYNGKRRSQSDHLCCPPPNQSTSSHTVMTDKVSRRTITPGRQSDPWPYAMTKWLITYTHIMSLPTRHNLPTVPQVMCQDDDSGAIDNIMDLLF